MTAATFSVTPSWLRVAQIVATIGLLALLWRMADGPETARILGGVEPVWLLAGLAALTLQTALSALRWRLTAAQLGIKLPLRHALLEYYLAQMINQAVPGGVVGDAARAVRSHEQRGLVAAGQAVVFERLAGQIGMFLALFAGFVATFAVPGGIEWPAWALPPVLLLLSAGAALPVAACLLARLPGRGGQEVRKLGRLLGRALAGRHVLRWQVLLSLGTTLCNLAAFAFCARAIGVVLPPVAVFALVPLILFTMLIPVAISGWGVREGAAAALFPLAGATPSEGFAASVAFGLVLLVAVLPGLLALWLRSRDKT